MEENTKESRVLDYSIEFYTWCKKLVSSDYKLFSNYNSKRSKNAINGIILEYNELLSKEAAYGDYYEILKNKVVSTKPANSDISMLEEYERIQTYWDSEISVKLFITALQFILVKDEILDAVKSKETTLLSMDGINTLSLTYDNISIKKPYALRVMTIMGINQYNWDPKKFTYKDELENMGIEIEGAVINILIESVNQSIKSEAGNSYEDKIEKLLTNELGIEGIERLSHSETGSIEHDFKFSIGEKKYSISAKRTLRERYKQYTNLIQNIPDIQIEDPEEIVRYEKYKSLAREQIIKDVDANVLITITLGTDLTTSKASTLRAFGVYIFIADEIYEKKDDLKKMDGVYPVSQFTLDVLESLK